MSRKKSQYVIFLGGNKRIRKIRGELTQAEFAKILGVTQGTVQKYEAGTASPGDDILNKIANHGKVSINWLLYGEDGPLNKLLAEPAPEGYEARPAEINAELLAEILEKVRDFSRRERPLTPIQEARLAAVVYDTCAQDRKKPDPLEIRRLALLLRD